MKTHTKGEWNFSKHGNNDSFGIYSTEGDGRDLAIVVGGNKENGEGEANARLIAAAPELLEALLIAKEFVVKDIEHFAFAGDECGVKESKECLDVIEQAIHKATRP